MSCSGRALGKVTMNRLLAILPFLFFSIYSLAQERILSFHSDIRLERDGSMIVTETILVQAENIQINRGIFRDFPTEYRDQLGNFYRVGFNVLDVLHNGQQAIWRVESLSNGERVYIGNPRVTLGRGEHEYVLRYRTNRQIGFFEEHDELYWNVTGNGWVFPIEQASATVTLPVEIFTPNLFLSGFTGPQGSTEQNYSAETSSTGGTIMTTSNLGSYEGLTLLLQFPKFIIDEPSASQRVQFFLRDNGAVLAGLGVLLVNLFYLWFCWASVGKDPEAGLIIPRYIAPEGYSPASARFVHNMKYDNRVFVSALVNLAVKGYIEISQEGENYKVSRLSSDVELAAGESAILDKLFVLGKEVELGEGHVFEVQTAMQAHRKSLEQDYHDNYFSTNQNFLIPATLLMVLVFAWTWFSMEVTIIAIVIYVVHGLMLALFSALLPSPSHKGRWLMDRLEGLKMYMEVADKDELDREPHPDMSTEHFERLLPFAIAMGVESAWSKKLREAVASGSIVATAGTGGTSYHPAWYSGDFNINRIDAFASSMTDSFSDAISSSATPPGGSSGGGGGGFSGGGGGGGGGGGW